MRAARSGATMVARVQVPLRTLAEERRFAPSPYTNQKVTRRVALCVVDVFSSIFIRATFMYIIFTIIFRVS